MGEELETNTALERSQAAFSHLELDEAEAERLALELVEETRREKNLSVRSQFPQNL